MCYTVSQLPPSGRHLASCAPTCLIARPVQFHRRAANMRQGDRPDLASNGEPSISHAAAATMFRVSTRFVQRAAKLKEVAPEAFEDVKRGELSLNKALKLGDPRSIGVLAFVTPLGSTLLLLAVRGQKPTVWVLAAAVLIVGAAAVAVRTTQAG